GPPVAGPGSWGVGEPRGPGFQPTPSNLLAPPVASCRQSGSWSEASTLMQKFWAVLIRAKLAEPLVGKKATSGGASETDENVPTTMPAGLPSFSVAVTTATPVG